MRTPKLFINELPPKCRKLMQIEEDNMDHILKNRFTSMLSGYATYFNNQNGRRENFFHRPFCRKWVKSEGYFEKVTYYIHANAIHHGLCDNIQDYEWTSYHDVLRKESAIISVDKLMSYFGGESRFLYYHQLRLGYTENETNEFIIEDYTVFAGRTENKCK